jgi:hypothetical protein
VPNIAGRIYLDGCFLRYDNYSFFGESVDPAHDVNVCYPSKENGLDQKRVEAVLLNVTKSAAAAKHKFAMEGGDGVFALAQCWETVDKENCERCLREAGKRVEECVPGGGEGRSLFTGCVLRYSTHKFFNDVVGNGVKVRPGSKYYFNLNFITNIQSC